MTLHVNYLGGPTTAADMRRMCALADDVGIDGIAMGDHVSFFNGFGTDALIRAASVLTASDRLRAMTAVYLLPLRHPVPVARQVVDLAALAPGRLTFGVGIGGEDPHELEVCGIDPRTRGRRMDEYLQVLRGLLTGESVTLEGEFVALRDAVLEPAPTRPVPILVGGRSDAAVRRAGRLGDGWLGVWISPRRYAQVVEQVAAHADASGRGSVEWHHAINVWCGIAPTVESARDHVAPAMEDVYQTPYAAFEKWSPAGPPELIAEFLAPYVDAGCHTFNIIGAAETTDEAVHGAAEIKRHLTS